MIVAYDSRIKDYELFCNSCAQIFYIGDKDWQSLNSPMLRVDKFSDKNAKK
jgi:hypothetical protein